MVCLLVYGWDGLPVFDDEVQDDPDWRDEEDDGHTSSEASVVVVHDLLLMALQMFSILRLMAVAMMRAPMMIADWVVMGLLLYLKSPFRGDWGYQKIRSDSTRMK
jgi:hypothetical protein